MSTWFNKRLEKIASFEKYSRPEVHKNMIRIDSNENLVIESSFIKKVAQAAASGLDLRQYPLEQFEILYDRLSVYTKINSKNFVIGSGSDQLLELFLATLGKDRKILLASPTFSYFITRCNLHGMPVTTIELDKDTNNDFDLDKFLTLAEKADILYLCSPNNPTGNQFDKEKVIKITKQLPDKLVLIDEAYVEFAHYSIASEAPNFGNLMVFRTLSKAFGLAGARVGYLVTNEEIAQVYRQTIQSPYPLSSFSLVAASEVLSHVNYISNTVEKVRKERDRIYNHLKKISWINISKSDANFLFFETGENYHNLLTDLLNNGLVVKGLGDLHGRKGCIRSTVATPEINDRFLERIDKLLG